MIVIGGDAIVDLIDRGKRLFEAYPGGSTLNCALAVGLMGSPVLYVSTLSTDSYGDLLVDRLSECDVRLRPNSRSLACSSLAIVSFDQNVMPWYTFYRNGTADREVPVADIVESFPKEMSAFHVGSCALIPREDRDAWFEIVQAAKQRGALISIDPNCRPSMTEDRDEYLEGLIRFFKAADIVKLSDEDLNYLHPEWSENALETFAEEYAPQLCVYTAGSDGLVGFTRLGVSARVPAVLPGVLADTVGAGDSLHGALLSEIERLNLIGDQMSRLDKDQLSEILTFAAQAAGINCTRAGCQPPTRQEITSIFG
jgi:fructokinase